MRRDNWRGDDGPWVSDSWSRAGPCPSAGSHRDAGPSVGPQMSDPLVQGWSPSQCQSQCLFPSWYWDQSLSQCWFLLQGWSPALVPVPILVLVPVSVPVPPTWCLSPSRSQSPFQ